jgi:hypothetical protein
MKKPGLISQESCRKPLLFLIPSLLMIFYAQQIQAGCRELQKVIVIGRNTGVTAYGPAFRFNFYQISKNDESGY